jgi:hypothetical protein
MVGLGGLVEKLGDTRGVGHTRTIRGAPPAREAPLGLPG